MNYLLLMLDFAKEQCDFENAEGQTGKDILLRNPETSALLNEIFSCKSGEH